MKQPLIKNQLIKFPIWRRRRIQNRALLRSFNACASYFIILLIIGGSPPVLQVIPHHRCNTRCDVSDVNIKLIN